MDEQGEHQEGWQANDLRSGVAKVYAEAKDRTTLGIRVATAWSVVTMVYAVLDFVGVTGVAPPLWDATAGVGAGMLAALAMSRTPGPMLGAAATVIVDLMVLAFQFPEMMERGEVADHVVAAIRIITAPVTILFVLNGYFGALSIQAFKKGFSPGADWRTRMNPRTVQVGIVLSCLVAIVVGVGGWVGAVMSGFAQTDVVWISHYLVDETVTLQTARNLEVEGAERKGKTGGVKFDIEVLEPPKPAVPEIVPYPDSARPVDTLKGLDDYAQSEVEDAWDFASDSDEAGCVAEGQGRQDRCRDDRCKHWARFFVRACLVRSAKTPKFCDGVPDPTEATAGTEWAQRLCVGRAAESCRELLFAVQGHCHPPRPDEPAPKPQGAAASK